MKRRAFLLCCIFLMFFIIGCGGNNTDYDDEEYELGIAALEIIDNYLDEAVDINEYYEETGNYPEDLNDIKNDMNEFYEDIDEIYTELKEIEGYVSQRTDKISGLLYKVKSTITNRGSNSDIEEIRNLLAESLNQEKR